MCSGNKWMMVFVFMIAIAIHIIGLMVQPSIILGHALILQDIENKTAQA